MIKEDAPTNNVGSGAIARTVGDPPVSRKAQRKIQRREKSTPTPVIINMLRRKAPNPIAESKVYAIATRTRKGGLRRVPDTRFESEENARRYGDKYHRGKDGARYYEVVEHPDSKKKKLKEDVDTFAGAMVFEVSPGVFHTAKMEKRKHKTWRKYLEEDDCLAEIREYANKNPGRPIILKNKNTGEMTYARYGKRR